MLRCASMLISATLLGGCVFLDWDYRQPSEASTGDPGGPTSGSGGAGATTSSSGNGSGGGGTGGSGAGGVSTNCTDSADFPVEVLALTEGSPQALALDKEHVYWSVDGPTAAERAIWRLDKAGASAPEMIALTGARVAQALAVDDKHLYWVERVLGICGVDGAADGLLRIEKADPLASPEVLWSGCGTPQGIALDATHVYVTMLDGDRVQRHDKLTLEQVNIGIDEGEPFGIAADEEAVYWANSFDEVIVRHEKGANAPDLLAFSVEPPLWVALDGGHVYWATETGVLRADKGGYAEEPQILGINDFDATSGLAVAGDYVYISDRANMSVLRGCKDGTGSLLGVAKDQGEPLNVTADDEAVYWVNHQGYQVMRALRQP